MVTETRPVVHLRDFEKNGRKHEPQEAFVACKSPRIIIRAGRRSGKTVGIAIKALIAFLHGRRVLYAAPTAEQTDRFWYEVTTALAEAIEAKVYTLNKAERFVEKPGALNRIKAKTAWDADTLRGDFADLLILDEWQLTNEDAWEIVGAPMLIDNNGDAVFIYTPPSLRSAGISKAHDPRHAAKMYKAAGEDTTGKWARFHFTSFANPFISELGLAEVMRDMSKTSYRQEILAEDDELITSHLVYGAFNEQVCKVPRFEIPLNWPVYSGHDFGGANPAGLFFARVRLPLPPGAPPYLRLNDFVAWREYLPSMPTSTALNVDAFKEIVKGRDGKSREVIKRAGGSHQETETRQGYAAHGWPILEPTITGPGSLRPQVDRVRGLMELNKVYVFDDMIHYLEELMSCAWKYDKEGVRTNNIENEARYHLCACARYILSDFTPETVSKSGNAFKPTTTFGESPTAFEPGSAFAN